MGIEKCSIQIWMGIGYIAGAVGIVPFFFSPFHFEKRFTRFYSFIFHRYNLYFFTGDFLLHHISFLELFYDCIHNFYIVIKKPKKGQPKQLRYIRTKLRLGKREYLIQTLILFNLRIKCSKKNKK